MSLLLRADLAPSPRTLVDILQQTAEENPDQPALDNGAEVLTYSEFVDAAEALADTMQELGIGPGDKVGVRIRSGTTELYIAIAGVLLAGAAYVPVDADDPDERARTVFEEASTVAVLGDSLIPVLTAESPAGLGTTEPREPGVVDLWQQLPQRRLGQ